MNFIVYKVTNMANGKLYFGITKRSLRERWVEHKCHKKKSTFLAMAIRKYGFSNFKIELIENCATEMEMYALEMALIAQHSSNNRKFGYNNSIGGELSSLGKKHSQESCKKMSLFRKNRPRAPMSEETKCRIGQANKFKLIPKHVREAQIKALTGKPAHNRKGVLLNGSVFYNSIQEASDKTGTLVPAIINNLKGRSTKTKVGVWQYCDRYN